jgi:mono/diheme cytochrome c family protein
MEDTMNRTAHHSLLLLAGAGLLIVASSLAQEKDKIKRTPIKDTSPTSGEEMFSSYCASCHGKDAKGNGPAASALKTAPADLTMLAKNNGGKFPSVHVATVLRTGVSGAHGSSDMPVWGPLFLSLSGGDQALVDMRISNLIHYLESKQVK